MKVLHVISGLDVGGAQMMLLRLARHASPGVVHAVVSLTDAEPMGRRFEEIDVPVQALGMRGFLDFPRAIRSIRRRLREEQPDLLQTWLYHADLVGGLAAWGLGIPVLWNLRHTDLTRSRNKRTTLWAVRVCAWLSNRLPRRIISCSKAAAVVHVGTGYDSARITVIPNGLDTQDFRPAPESAREVRRELGLAEDAVLIGSVGRFHPQKDPDTLLEAAALVLSDRPDAHLALVGDGFTPANTELASLIERGCIAGQVHLLGERRDIARLDAAFDLFVSSSAGEGFSNAILEAMACGVPCVVTEVGDSANIVAETGRIVPPRNAAALAATWAEILDRDRADRKLMGERARERIVEFFSIHRIRDRYEEVWGAVAGKEREGLGGTCAERAVKDGAHVGQPPDCEP